MLKLKLNPEKRPATEDAVGPKIRVKKPRKSKVKEQTQTPVPRLSLNLSKKVNAVPRIRVKAARRPGDGYDSEAPDREEDPVIEEALILRMLPGEHLDYLRAACEQGDLTKVSIKFKDSRRAVVSIHDQLFAAQLVDLPTITEAQKSFDRKNMYKSADVCQLLLVTEPIETEDDVLTVATESQQHPHGLTPPLFNAKKRRFRKRISNKVIESVEARVDELFKLDEEAEESTYELLNPNQLTTPAAAMASVGESEPSTPFDMLGSAVSGDEQIEDDEGDEDLLGMELEKALQEDEEEEEKNDDDDDEEDEDEEDERDDDMDEDQIEAMYHNQLLREEIAELESTIVAKSRDADSTQNQIMRGRLLDVVNKLQQELDMKRRQLKADHEETTVQEDQEDGNEEDGNEEDGNEEDGNEEDVNEEDANEEDANEEDANEGEAENENDEEEGDDDVESLF
jgi:transcription initiation factor TFIID subunit 7